MAKKKPKNEAAAALARLRHSKSTAAARSELGRTLAAAANASMTPEQRSARAKKAVDAREAKRRREKREAAKADRETTSDNLENSSES